MIKEWQSSRAAPRSVMGVQGLEVVICNMVCGGEATYSERSTRPRRKANRG